MRNGKHGKSIVWKKKCLEVGFEGVQRELLSERKGTDISSEVTEEKPEAKRSPGSDRKEQNNTHTRTHARTHTHTHTLTHTYTHLLEAEGKNIRHT